MLLDWKYSVRKEINRCNKEELSVVFVRGDNFVRSS